MSDSPTNGADVRTHDLTGPPRMGYGYTVLRSDLGGLSIGLVVHNPARIVPGDLLLLCNRGATTRYRVLHAEAREDPGDQYFVDAVFHPRLAGEVDE